MKKIPLTQGKFALVDDEDFEYLNQWKWFAHINRRKSKTIYAMRHTYTPGTQKRSAIYMHRLLLRAKKGQICDHKNGNGLDNRKLNLRFCSLSESSWNKVKFSSKKLDAMKGVTIVKDRNGIPSYWIARITVNKNRIYLGTFRTKRLAEKAMKIALKKYHGEFAKW